MVPRDYSSLLYFRRFPDSYGYCWVNGLFSDANATQGYFPESQVPMHWEYPCEFSSVDYGEPLECVHARRTAFGGSEARIAEEAITPDRSLLFSTPSQRMESYGHVSIRWTVPGVMEVPKFCISSATSDQNRVQWGFGPHRIEMLQAALTLEPSQYDVFGFCTPDQRLIGAVEFTGLRYGESFGGHVFVAANGRELMIGDELWGWYTCNIGDTQLQARRLLAIVERIPGLPVPKLEA